jgi:hypothetical protein
MFIISIDIVAMQGIMMEKTSRGIAGAAALLFRSLFFLQTTLAPV